MRFSLASLAALAFAVVSAVDDTNFNNAFKPAKGEEIPAGKTYKVEWTLPSDAKKGPISILLVGGADQGSQQVLSTLTKGYDNSKLFYDWAVDASLKPLAVYGLKFVLDSDANTYQWSNPFQIVGGGSGGNDTNTSKSASSSSTSSPPSQSTLSTTISTSTSIVTSGTTTVPPPTGSTGGPAPTTTGPTATTSTPAANTTRPGTVPPNAAAGFSASGPLAFIGGLAALMLVL